MKWGFQQEGFQKAKRANKTRQKEKDVTLPKNMQQAPDKNTTFIRELESRSSFAQAKYHSNPSPYLTKVLRKQR